MPPAEGSPRDDRGNGGRSVGFRTRLPADRTAAASARRLVRTRLGRLVAADALDDILLVVSELVTNAVRHGRGDVELKISFDGNVLSGEVCDGGDGFVAAQDSSTSGAVGGNGLHIVDRLTQRWGVAEGSARVWFEISDAAMATAGA